MLRLLPPPQFTLPPPPMFPSDIFDSKILLQLTCSSIRQQQINPPSILISCIIFFLIAIILTLLFISIQFYCRKKTSTNNLHSKPTSTICNSRSYETISSGVYLESINTSATTLSTNPSSIISNYYHRISSPPPSYYDILPI